MKMKLTNLLIFSLILTTIGFLMDGDTKEPSMVLRFTEYFAMTALIFTATSILYFSASFTMKKFQKIRS
ncbi:hypothetical protein LNP04_15050 [Chryseobacterium sp. C-71]|uniref:hypothetical protein n=1 Tax=Chryseobacterium sp. C-71 TaxID=2893882 RepID=UPI001E3FAB0C|nr:hypothetical protein [Chryseobacterium sp. C-71]UFH31279.1 hypothetical protein LNP04_15050 [Chryseobacterium sp. C-71]